jgi:hypothetical protein
LAFEGRVWQSTRPSTQRTAIAALSLNDNTEFIGETCPRAEGPKMRHPSQGRELRIRSAHVVWVLAVLLTATFIGSPGNCRAESAITADDPGDHSRLNATKSVSLSETDFDAFFRQRDKLRQLPELAGQTELSRLPDDLRVPPEPFMIVRSPTRREYLSRRTLKIDLSTKDWSKVLPALAYFPEITQVYVTYDSDLRYRGNIDYEPAPFEQSPVPISLLTGLLKLPHLDMLVIRGGLWTMEAAELLAKNPSLRQLGLGRCRFNLEAFSKLSALKTLEDVSVIVGLDPRSFMTLAKLPRLRSFTIGSTEEFNVPLTKRPGEPLNPWTADWSGLPQRCSPRQFTPTFFERS